MELAFVVGVDCSCCPACGFVVDSYKNGWSTDFEVLMAENPCIKIRRPKSTKPIDQSEVALAS